MPIFVGNTTVNTQITNSNTNVMTSMDYKAHNFERNSIAPVLNIDFINTSGVVDPRVTVVRASSASRWNQYGVLETVGNDVPRIEWNPYTKEIKGLLAEQATTNRLLRSEEFGNSAWIKTNTTVTDNSNTSPSNTLTADTLTATANNGTIKQNSNNPATQIVRNFSVFLKRKTGTGRVLIRLGNNEKDVTSEINSTEWRRVWLHGLAMTGTYTVTSNVNTTTITNHLMETGDVARIATVGGGGNASTSITRVDANTFTYTNNVANTSGTTTVFPATPYIVLENNGDEVFAWGAQVEVATSITSYVPTTTAIVTRAGERIIYTNQSDFLNWFNTLEGTLIREFQIPEISLISSGSLFSFYSGFTDGLSATSNCMYLRWVAQPSNSYNDFIVYNSTTLVVDTGNFINSTTNIKQGMVYKLNDFKSCTNGGTLYFDTAGLVPTVNTFIIAESMARADTLGSSYIRKLIYYPKSISNNELQSLTSI